MFVFLNHSNKKKKTRNTVLLTLHAYITYIQIFRLPIVYNTNIYFD